MYCTKITYSHHYASPNLRDNIRIHIKVGKTCQKNKKQNLKYGKLTAKEAEAIP